jgi:hypothetical protein
MTSERVCTCTANTVVEFAPGDTSPSIPYTQAGAAPTHRCHDCNVQIGGFHHPGCDMEECPRCYGQLISCGCIPDPEDEDEDEW